MAVGASQPSVVATKDGRIGMKNQMQVSNFENVYMKKIRVTLPIF